MGKRVLTTRDIQDIAEYFKDNNPLVKYCPFRPFNTQKELLKSTAKEILFSGSAGNGKTIASLMAALKDVDNKYYSCLIIRNTYHDLSQPGCQIPLSKQWLTDSDAIYNEVLKQWSFPSGAKIAFGYLENENDKYKYRSSEYTRIIIDEASLCQPDAIQYMFSRLRTNLASGLKTQLILLSNPGGPAHEYIRSRYIDSPAPGTQYIFSTFRDNPTLNQEEYEANLKNLTEIEYRQLALGEWILDENKNVYHLSQKNIIRPQEIDFKSYIMGIDLGYNDDSSIVITGSDGLNKKLYVVFCKKFAQTIVSDLAIYARELYNQYGCEKIVVDSAGPGKMITEELRRRYDLPAYPAIKQEKEAYIKLLNADLEHERILIYETCTDLIKELEKLQRNKHWKENQTQSNHAADAFLYAYKESRYYKNEAPKPRKTPTDLWEEEILNEKQEQKDEWADLF